MIQAYRSPSNISTVDIVVKRLADTLLVPGFDARTEQIYYVIFLFVSVNFWNGTYDTGLIPSRQRFLTKPRSLR